MLLSIDVVADELARSGGLEGWSRLQTGFGGGGVPDRVPATSGHQCAEAVLHCYIEGDPDYAASAAAGRRPQYHIHH